MSPTHAWFATIVSEVEGGAGSENFILNSPEFATHKGIPGCIIAKA